MREQIAEQIQLLTQLQNTPSLQDKLETAVRWISGALRDGLPVLLCGNGGSAADALHISGSWLKIFDRAQGVKRNLPECQCFGIDRMVE